MPAHGKRVFGQNILRARQALGWSQEELAHRLGYKSKSTINKIEKGINDIPQQKIAEFARVLGTTPATLLGLVDDETRAKTEATAGIVVRMRSDPRFREAVMLLYEEENEDTFGKMLDMLRLLK